MLKNQRISSRALGRGFAEFGVIVLGVLVALAADRWREARGDEALRDQYLVSLIENVRSDVESFQATSNGTQVERAALILSAARGDTPSAEGFVPLIYEIEALQWYNPPVVARQTYDDLISTGNLTLLELELRRVLSEYNDRVSYFQQREELFAQLLASGYRHAPSRILGPELHPELFDRIQVRRAAGIPEVPTDWEVEDRIQQTVLAKLRSLPELEDWIAERLYVDRQHAEIYGDRLFRHAQGLLRILEGVRSGELAGAAVQFETDEVGN